MKFTDKFVLVPIERYHRLMNVQDADKKKVTNKITEKQQKGGNKLEVGEVEEREGGGKKEGGEKGRVEEEETGEGEEGEEEKEGNFSSAGEKIKSYHKFPLPPPGTPNKVKSIDFKWFPLPKKVRR